MNDLEMRILEVLTDDARTSAKQIAVMLGREEAEVSAAIRSMEERRIILKYPALINWDKVESGEVEALIEVRVTPQRDHGFDAIAEQIYRFEEVRNVYLMSGGYDLLVMLKAPTPEKAGAVRGGKALHHRRRALHGHAFRAQALQERRRHHR